MHTGHRLNVLYQVIPWGGRPETVMRQRSKNQQHRSAPGSGRRAVPEAAHSLSFRTGQKLLFVLGLLGIAATLFMTGLGLGIWASSSPEQPKQAHLDSQVERRDTPLGKAIVRPNRSKTIPKISRQPASYPEDAISPVAPALKPADIAVTPAVNPRPIPQAAAENPTHEAWLNHAIKIPLDENNRPLIAIVIDDMGVARRRSRRAISLPAPLTMAFLPYAEKVAEQAAAARTAGHELLVHIPMQPIGYNSDPGPNVLDERLGTAEVHRRLLWNLSQFEGYVGFNNHMGSRFTASQDAMAAIMTVAQERGLLFLDSRTSALSIGFETARATGVTAAIRDVFLDNTDSVEEVQKRLRQTMERAQARGSAIAIAHPRDSTLDVLEAWLPEIEAKGFRLAPLSAVVLKRQGLQHRQAAISKN